MSNQSPFSRRGQAFPTLPRGDLLGSYESYPEAQAVVDTLAKREFPVAKLSIIGSDLKTVERVTGKLTYGRSALTGAASGAWFGLFFGLIMFLFSGDPASLAFVGAALLIGAGFGMIFGIVSYTLNRRRRDFTSTHQVLASSYQIIVDPALSLRAQQLLERTDPHE
ncbi:hypothetical protein FB562_0423 [Homoserinimonas aerilata]|uniref:General stress protein 17M-like domain-containing protein n=1 Tax=Homoserinimonas aerilata TaxID=1162970 RepID=A0A542YH02_9MICO|nr:general stress protein [Homoserinimonas aerilata]TQL47367.1 hypothetical protein FB562_0423 [Homoserinimonas aerilata]